MLFKKDIVNFCEEFIKLLEKHDVKLKKGKFVMDVGYAKINFRLRKKAK